MPDRAGRLNVVSPQSGRVSITDYSDKIFKHTGYPKQKLAQAVAVIISNDMCIRLPHYCINDD